jgi:two-component system LytT family sensor kinase
MEQSKTFRIVLHVAGWFLFFSLILAFSFSSPGDGITITRIPAAPFLIFCFTFLFLFYLNNDILIPKLYLHQKYLPYFAIILLLFLLVYFERPFDSLINHTRPTGNPPPHLPPRPGPPEPGRGRPRLDIVSIVLFVMTWSFSSALQIIRQWRSTEARAIRAEADKVNAELSVLKAQINPHFLFNTLNNIYSMAVSKSDHTPTAIMKLSNILRYVTDEVSQDFVPLRKEMDCAADYIDLQRMRLTDRIVIDYSVTGQLQGKQVAPLILMSFIENIFKYGISSHEPSVITIHLNAEDDKIIFYCRNRIFNADSGIERTGIGIANARQRLQHLYPDRHELTITNDGQHHTVALTLHLQ